MTYHSRGVVSGDLHLSKIGGCVYFPFATHLSLNNLAKHEKEEREERD
jgi:hypothetical protein